MGETESTGLRNERSQASDLHDDSAVKQRANLTEQARELSRERERERWSEVREGDVHKKR